ncbi:Nucleotide-binding universal stress protein, UspA family [Maribacter orientalis]|uniref:Nucleotide-binding universal stress protein, UspA family n=1 Tax=Maribacter orientalis TaxID=228957 RepID=A0A1H7NRZ9_9FLAO|nr:universal stress protein [Maribacter orientalis]SEL26141.1 Nucleotide-binding universal stress protein, UspA family [Maribacter orientalis]
MKKILIPTDFSKNSKNSIRYAVDLFKENPCQFFILYINIEGSNITEKPVYEFGTNVLVEIEPKAISHKLKDLEKFIASLSSKKEHHHFTTMREQGYFLTTIRKHIQEKEIDLIIMGTRGASELKEFFIGTRSGDVITKVECDVLVVPDKAKFKNFKQVVIPIDFEVDFDDSILRKIANNLNSEKAQIKLLYVTKSQMPLFEEIELQQEQLVQRLSEKLPNPISFHRVVSKQIEDGIQIFAESMNADLIIMISKDYGLIQRSFLDTTVEEVSFNTSIPLLSLQG